MDSHSFLSLWFCDLSSLILDYYKSVRCIFFFIISCKIPTFASSVPSSSTSSPPPPHPTKSFSSAYKTMSDIYFSIWNYRYLACWYPLQSVDLSGVSLSSWRSLEFEWYFDGCSCCCIARAWRAVSLSGFWVIPCPIVLSYFYRSKHFMIWLCSRLASSSSPSKDWICNCRPWIWSSAEGRSNTESGCSAFYMAAMLWWVLLLSWSWWLKQAVEGASSLSLLSAPVIVVVHLFAAAPIRSWWSMHVDCWCDKKSLALWYTCPLLLLWLWWWFRRIDSVVALCLKPMKRISVSSLVWEPRFWEFVLVTARVERSFWRPKLWWLRDISRYRSSPPSSCNVF